MRVKELIEELKKLNQDVKVYCLFLEDNPLQNNGANIDYVFEIRGAGKDKAGVYIREE